MSKIISIGTALPAFSHAQEDILPFIHQIYTLNEGGRRKLNYLTHQTGIRTRYSVIPDYSLPAQEWKFYPHSESLEPFPSLEQRMQWYDRYAAALSVDAIRSCLAGKCNAREITHLLTVSCTGMSAPGLDLQVAELMGFSPTIFRTSINFMGCYAAIHALKLADAICLSSPESKVLIVCTELCTLHFQKAPTMDNIMSSLLFADGSAAALVTGNAYSGKGWRIEGFHSRIIPKGKKDMAWELSSTGFQMTLSGYVPDLIEEDFAGLVKEALDRHQLRKEDIRHWCIHPGGRKILESIHKSVELADEQLAPSYAVLAEYGNMSSPTVLFVLQKIMKMADYSQKERTFGAAFGPGLTVETFLVSNSMEI